MSYVVNGLYHYQGNQDILEGMSVNKQKKEISSFIKKRLLTNNLNFLLGSGCSFSAIPSMGDTFKKIKPELKKSAIGKYYEEENDNIEDYLNWLNTALKFLSDSGESDKNIKDYQDNFLMTKEALLKSINIDYKAENSVMDLYIQFYNEIFSVRDNKDYTPVNIFTTNYDLFNEVALEKTNIRYTNGFRGIINRAFDPSEFNYRLVDDMNRYKDKWSIVRKFVKLYKVHGSIDWFYDSNTQKVMQTSNSHHDTQNALIYPTINKHIETQQTPYSELFREFTINLQKSNSTLIVLGYGFPDQHINQLISQALSNEDFTLIVFANLGEEKIEAFYSKHKNIKNIHVIGGCFSEDTSFSDGHHFDNIIRFMKGVGMDD
ncbi:SIR2 family protein [Oceanobacillus manasiensis]|uniref:SIR2 family protein n=1 Tax=Oceanobacillus manasiensis TaxID=586413 RepID=UPI000693E095|nr:SIR2 family protein [Oceanobacillus manasiensis]